MVRVYWTSMGCMDNLSTDFHLEFVGSWWLPKLVLPPLSSVEYFYKQTSVIWSPVFVFDCHRDFFFLPSLQATKSMSIRLSATPGFWGRVVIPIRHYRFFVAPEICFHVCWLVKRGKESKRKEKRKPLCSLSH